MTLPDIKIIERTELGGGRVIVTARRRKPHLIRQFATFLSTPTARYALRLTDSASEREAIAEHEDMVRRFTARRTLEK